MQSIQDVCREQRDRLRMTAQAIADESGVPLSTVNNFFSSASKKPNADTAGPICKVLGVSLDAYFGIEAPGRELSEHEQAMLEKDLTYEREKIAMMEKSIREKNRVVYILLGLCGLLAVLLGICLRVDFSIADAGLIQFGDPSPLAWAMIAVIVLTVVFLVWGINHARKK